MIGHEREHDPQALVTTAGRDSDRRHEVPRIVRHYVQVGQRAHPHHVEEHAVRIELTGDTPRRPIPARPVRAPQLDPMVGHPHDHIIAQDQHALCTHRPRHHLQGSPRGPHEGAHPRPRRHIARRHPRESGLARNLAQRRGRRHRETAGRQLALALRDRLASPTWTIALGGLTRVAHQVAAPPARVGAHVHEEPRGARAGGRAHHPRHSQLRRSARVVDAPHHTGRARRTRARDGIGETAIGARDHHAPDPVGGIHHGGGAHTNPSHGQSGRGAIVGEPPRVTRQPRRTGAVLRVATQCVGTGPSEHPAWRRRRAARLTLKVSEGPVGPARCDPERAGGARGVARPDLSIGEASARTRYVAHPRHGPGARTKRAPTRPNKVLQILLSLRGEQERRINNAHVGAGRPVEAPARVARTTPEEDCIRPARGRHTLSARLTHAIVPVVALPRASAPLHPVSIERLRGGQTRAALHATRVLVHGTRGQIVSGLIAARGALHAGGRYPVVAALVAIGVQKAGAADHFAGGQRPRRCQVVRTPRRRAAL